MAAGPPDTPLSITSGYRVPCASHWNGPFFFATSTKMSANSSPIMNRFFSGSFTPPNFSRNRLSGGPSLLSLSPYEYSILKFL